MPQLRYRYRLVPTPGQRMALAKAFGCARVVFNDGLRLRRAAYKAGQSYVKDGDVQKRVITAAKQTPERAWLAEVASVVLVQACNDLHQAYRNFFASKRGERKGPKIGPPTLRRKRGPQAIRLTTNGFAVTPGGVRVAKIGNVRVRWSRPLPSTPSSATVLLDTAGRYFVSFVVEAPAIPAAPPATTQECGIDLGLTHFATLDDGRTIENPRFLRKAARRLGAAQRALSRKRKGSKNRQKARLRVGKLQARVKDTRLDWLHKQTTALVRENQALYVEDLSVSGLARGRLAKSVHDASWGTFLRLLKEKARRYGRTLGVVGRFAPTSQVCSTCGVRDGPKPLSVLEWTCLACGAVHDRDVNAAKNIKALGQRDLVNACGADVSPPQGVAVGAEAGTHRGAAA